MNKTLRYVTIICVISLIIPSVAAYGFQSNPYEDKGFVNPACSNSAEVSIALGEGESFALSKNAILKVDLIRDQDKELSNEGKYRNIFADFVRISLNRDVSSYKGSIRVPYLEITRSLRRGEGTVAHPFTFWLCGVQDKAVIGIRGLDKISEKDANNILAESKKSQPVLATTRAQKINQGGALGGESSYTTGNCAKRICDSERRFELKEKSTYLGPSYFPARYESGEATLANPYFQMQ